ncbi:ATP-binding protein [Pedobacter sp. Hv1]|uniref:tetratricopeptide repeat-containing sensor histidine kinase n=1 Tax=Pedobacter sp. Hv1 TaxID=1740090 RepID=UPI00128EBF71|nr:ATP-binding protein [Pedobacter sp. Hv1]
MKRIFTSILFCFLFCVSVAAQPSQSQFQKGKAQDSLRKLYRFNKTQRKDIEHKLLQQYNKTHDKELFAFLEVLKSMVLMKPNSPFVEKFRNEVDAKYSAFPNVQARAYQILGYHYFIGDINYEKAFDAYLQLEKLLEIYGPKVITDYADYCSEIASAYYKFKNYKKAVELAKNGVNYANDKWDFYNTIGLCYGELSQADTSIYYLKKAVAEAIQRKKPDIYRTISLGNIGNSYYSQQKFQLAKPLLTADLKGALRIDDKGLAVGAAIPLADIYLSEQKWKPADSLLTMARTYIAQSGQTERLERFFPIRSKYYQLRGHLPLAIAYRDSAINAIKRNDSIFNNLLVMRVQQRTDMEKLTEEKSKLENYRKVSQIRLWAVSIILILTAMGILIVRGYRSRLEKNKKHIEELNRLLALRQQLSADMHDDIGSTLSSISLYTHSLLMQPQTAAQQLILEKIKQNAQHVQESVSDIIWSVNPHMDQMAQVVARMRAFGADMTEHAGIAFVFNFEEEVIKLVVEMSARRNLYLIYKEAINNAVKYSACKQITVTLTGSNDRFGMEISDNGIGFEIATQHQGNGLQNMQHRADEMNGTLAIISKQQQGTRLTLNFTLSKNS